MTDLIPVWVTEADDGGWVINTEDEMWQTYADHLDQIADTMTISINGNDYDFEPSVTFEMADPDSYQAEFRLWRESWTRFDMPVEVHNSDAAQAWVDNRMGI